MVMLSTTLFLILAPIQKYVGSEIVALVSGYNDKITKIGIGGSDASISEPSLQRLGEYKVDQDISWLQVEGRYIYAAHEVESYGGKYGGAISRWNYTGEGLLKLETMMLPTISPAHLLVVREKHLAFAANYFGSSLSAVRLESDGSFGDIVLHEDFRGRCGKVESHPHQTVIFESWMWVVDLGCDTIWHFKIVKENLINMGTNTKLREGLGPRHMVILEEKRLAFVVCELQSLVQVYR